MRHVVFSCSLVFLVCEFALTLRSAEPETLLSSSLGVCEEIDNSTLAKPNVKLKIHLGDTWAIAAPEDWRVFDRVRPPTVLYLTGDSRNGEPLFDGTLAPLMMRLLVDVFPKEKRQPKELAEEDIKTLTASKQFKLRSKPKIEELRLSDGTLAWYLQAEFDRLDNHRWSSYQKLFCTDERGQLVVATGIVTCGPAGGSFVKSTGLDRLIKSYLDSFVLDADQLDHKKLDDAHAAHRWDFTTAFPLVEKGNDQLTEEDYAEAIQPFREAIAICPELSAAHNGLAWALLQSKDATAETLAGALQHAKKAVELTEELDPSAVDTLALAYSMNGDQESAIAIVKKALIVYPNHPDLLQRLKVLQDDK